jgi:hypothetical protein
MKRRMLGSVFITSLLGILIVTPARASAQEPRDSAASYRASPVFDSRPGHPWDEAREVFYVRRFPTGEVFDHPHASAPPWVEFYPFTFDATLYEQALARLSAVEKLPPAQMEEQPALRRMIFLRDLWPVFDGLSGAHNKWPAAKDKAATSKALARRDELLRHVARVMKRLELSDEEVRSLPDAFKIVADKKLYPKSFDPSSPKAFFPTDLLERDGPWVEYSREPAPSAGGVSHRDFVGKRSVFTLHLRTPDGRAGGMKYLNDFTKSEGQQAVPPGTMLALLRRALVPSRSGKLLVSPFVESLQLIVATLPEDHRFKFTLDRQELLAGGHGLKLLGKDDPIDTSSFEAAFFYTRIVSFPPPEPSPANESLVRDQFKTLRDVPSSLGNCVECHNARTDNNIFGFSGPIKAAYLQTDFDQAAAAVARQKEASEEWKTYLRLRDARK